MKCWWASLRKVSTALPEELSSEAGEVLVGLAPLDPPYESSNVGAPERFATLDAPPVNDY